MVFKDINPKADVHLLVIPREHVASLADIAEEHDQLMAYMMRLLPRLAREQGLEHGFRTIINGYTVHYKQWLVVSAKRITTPNHNY